MFGTPIYRYGDSSVFELNKDLEIPIINANEVFLTNVVTGIVPVLSISGSEIGSGKPGIITDNLANAYREHVLSEIS